MSTPPAPRRSVPFVDLKRQHEEVADEVTAGIARVIESSSFILGDEVRRFEQAFATFSGAAHCIGVANGTEAVELAIRACDLGPGDEVIVPANTFIATALGVMRAGAKPVLVDCDEHHLLDPRFLESSITERTRAILPVHLYGQVADMDAIGNIASARGLVVLEDHAQSQGASRNGRPAGSFGKAAATSFYPGKNLGAYGDAGAVLTSDDEVAARLKRLRNYGSEQKYFHPEIGFNSRLDSLQAVVLSAKLNRLAEWNTRRNAAAARYIEMLDGVDGVELPKVLPGNQHVWHLFVVRVPERDRVLATLHQHGIGAGVHYPTPLHLHGAMAHLGYQEGAFPMAEACAREGLSLPLFPHIEPAEQERVVEELSAALR